MPRGIGAPWDLPRSENSPGWEGPGQAAPCRAPERSALCPGAAPGQHQGQGTAPTARARGKTPAVRGRKRLTGRDKHSNGIAEMHSPFENFLSSSLLKGIAVLVSCLMEPRVSLHFKY